MTEQEPEDRLAELDLPSLDPGLRKRLLATTALQIRRRKHLTRFYQIVPVVLAFVAGMVVMRPTWRFDTAAPAQSIADQSPADPAPAVSVSQPDPDSTLYDDPEALAFAYDAADEAGKLRILKTAGDHELNVNQNVRAALDYYRQWIVLADASTRSAYDETDTWLLASLKYAP